MTCPICNTPAETDPCAACAARLVRLRPATRATVARAAWTTVQLLAHRQDDAELPALSESIALATTAGRRW